MPSAHFQTDFGYTRYITSLVAPSFNRIWTEEAQPVEQPLITLFFAKVRSDHNQQ